MGVLSVKNYNAMQGERKAEFLSNLDRTNLSQSEIDKMCASYFPFVPMNYGFVTFDDRTKSTEIRWYKKKPF